MKALNRLITLGRWILVATQAWAALALVFCGLLAAQSLATRQPRLHVNEPWDTILVVAIFAPSVAIVLAWGALCLALIVLLRRRRRAGSLGQLIAILRLLVPIAGVCWYDRLARELTVRETHDPG